MPRIRGLREAAFWVLAGLSLILLLALLSYSPSDPAFSVAGGDEAVTNRMGPAGAWFADVAFLLFGASAYLFPILVLIAGVFLFRGEDLPERRPAIWRGAGFMLIIATSSGLATLHFDSPDLRETAGGILGRSSAGVSSMGSVCWALRCCCSCSGSPPCSSRPAFRGSRSWTARAAPCIAPLGAQNLGRDARIWWEGRRAKQQRDEIVTKVRAKPKTTAPRIEPPSRRSRSARERRSG